MKKAGAWMKAQGYKFYPVLFALFPLLSFYGTNEAEIRSGDFSIATFLIFNLVVVGAVWPLTWLLTRNAKKASILTVVVLVIFFIFGRLHEIMGDFAINTPITPVGPTKILLLASAILLFLAWLGIRRLSDKGTNITNLTLTVVGIYLVFSSLTQITFASLSNKDNGATTKNTTQVTNQNKKDPKDLPDLYYIILDAYGRQDILKLNFNFDNSTFINALKDRGFYVADKSNSNYAHTHWSVPSTLNMKYLNYLTDEMGEDSSDRRPLRRLTTYNEAVPTFKSFGYKYINIGSLAGWTKESPLADIEVKTKKETDSKLLNIRLDEFAVVYLQTTALKPWILSNIRGTLLAQTLSAFERTEKVSTINEPTFTFSHITVPHPPYLLDRSGPIAGLTDKLALDNPGFSNRKGFVEQTIYTNKLTLRMIDAILRNSARPPIIIVASDHGPASSLSQADFDQTDPEKFNVKGIRERMAILNAYYLPDKNYSQLYPTMTPVNSFRVILNQYFNKKIGLLPDRSYFSKNKGNEYRLFDVTDLVSDEKEKE